jgi:hypothetical protein
MPSVSFYSPLARRTYFSPIRNILPEKRDPFRSLVATGTLPRCDRAPSSMFLVELSGTAPESEP